VREGLQYDLAATEHLDIPDFFLALRGGQSVGKRGIVAQFPVLPAREVAEFSVATDVEALVGPGYSAYSGPAGQLVEAPVEPVVAEYATRVGYVEYAVGGLGNVPVLVGGLVVLTGEGADAGVRAGPLVQSSSLDGSPSRKLNSKRRVVGCTGVVCG
jgi:hypothetical protein